MTVKQSIGWCTHTVNPVQGCLGPTGKPCSYCYAVRFRKRLAGVKGTIQHALREAAMDINAPAIARHKLVELDGELHRARKARRVFFGSMADLGYDGLYHDVEIDGRVHPRAIGGQAVRQLVRDLFSSHPRHTFLILSKQPRGLLDIEWPDNAHVGVSLSTSRPAERDRVRVLREVTCGLRWASVEPLRDHDFDGRYFKGLDWVAVGVETGPGAATPEVFSAAAGRIVEWCQDVYGIPVFVKPNLRHVAGYEWPTELPT